MSLVIFSGVILFGFFIFLFVWMFRKDEKYLHQMAKQIQANKLELRDLQAEIESLQYKIDFINRICNTMKKELFDKEPNRQKEEAYEKVNQSMSSDLTRLQEEVTSLKNLINDDYKKVFENL